MKADVPWWEAEVSHQTTSRGSVRGPVPVAEFIESVRGDKHRDVVERIRSADKAEGKRLKARLPLFTPSGTFRGRARTRSS